MDLDVRCGSVSKSVSVYLISIFGVLQSLTIKVKKN